MAKRISKAKQAARATDDSHRLRLYIAGFSLHSLRAVQNVTRICESELAGHYALEIVDIYKEPDRVKEDRIVAIPTLIKHAPGLERRMVGDMSETTRLRHGLDLR